MIKTLDSVDEVIKILQTDDDVLEKLMPCTKGEWVQFLCQNIDNPKFEILGEMKDNVLESYIVLIDSIIPPVFDSVVILYLFSPENHKTTRMLVEKGKEWAIKIGAKKGIISVPIDHSEKYMSVFGGEKIANVYEWRIE